MQIYTVCINRVLPKSTLCMNSWWLGTAEVSHKKAHFNLQKKRWELISTSTSIWAFLKLTSAVPNHQEFMQRVDLGKSLLSQIFAVLVVFRFEMSFWTDFVIHCNFLVQKGSTTSKKCVGKLSVLLSKIEFWGGNRVFESILLWEIITRRTNYFGN